MKKRIIIAISNQMEKIALKIAGSASCAVIWGEVPLPDELRKEVEIQKYK